MDLPESGGGALESIIDRCWHGKFDFLRDLAAAAGQLEWAQKRKEPVTVLSEKYCQARREECQRMVDEGLMSPLGSI